MRAHKYNAKKSMLFGKLFDSKAEGYMYLKLQEMAKDRRITDLKTQVEYELQPRFRSIDGKGVRNIRYVADFVFYDYEQKRTRVLDAKGFVTPEFALKRKLFDYKYKSEGLYIETNL